jgi:hypothetical protein
MVRASIKTSMLIVLLCSLVAWRFSQSRRQHERDRQFSLHFEEQDLFAPIDLRTLIMKCDAVVVVEVMRVEESADHKRYATARVIECWSGKVGPSIKYICASERLHDISNAVVGETALLFLEHGPGNDRSIAHLGRGRMPIYKTNEVVFVTIFDDIKLPADLRTIPGPGAKTPTYRSAELRSIEAIVRGVRP